MELMSVWLFYSICVWKSMFWLVEMVQEKQLELMLYARLAAKESEYYSVNKDNIFVADLKSEGDLVFKPRVNAIIETQKELIIVS